MSLVEVIDDMHTRMPSSFLEEKHFLNIPKLMIMYSNTVKTILCLVSPAVWAGTLL